MEARKLRRRLDKMARDRGRLYTSREKEEREMKIIVTNIRLQRFVHQSSCARVVVTYNYSAIAIPIDMLAWECPIVCSAHILQQTSHQNIDRLVEPATSSKLTGSPN